MIIRVWVVGKRTSNIHLQRTLPYPGRGEQVTQSFRRVAYCSEGLIQLKQGTECDRVTNLTRVCYYLQQYTTASTVVWSLLQVGNCPRIQTKLTPDIFWCDFPDKKRYQGVFAVVHLHKCVHDGARPLQSTARPLLVHKMEWPERWKEEWLSCPYTCRSVSLVPSVLC